MSGSKTVHTEPNTQHHAQAEWAEMNMWWCRHMHIYTHTHSRRSRTRNINSAINLKAEYWTLRSSISRNLRKHKHTHTQSRSPVVCMHIQPLSLSPPSSPVPSICTLSSFISPLLLLLTFTRLLWSIPLSSSPPASWMLKQEIKGWRSTLSGNQRCLGAFQSWAAGQADAQQMRAGERATQYTKGRHGKVRNGTSVKHLIQISENHGYYGVISTTIYTATIVTFCIMDWHFRSRIFITCTSG